MRCRFIAATRTTASFHSSSRTTPSAMQLMISTVLPGYFLWPLSVSLDAICSARLPIPSPLKFTYGIEIGFLPPGRDEYSSGRRNRHPDVVAVGQDTRFCGRRLSLREIFFEEHSRF